MIPPNNIWWLSRPPPPPMSSFSKQIWVVQPLNPSKVFSDPLFWVLSYDWSPPFVLLKMKWSPPQKKSSPRSTQAINNDRSFSHLLPSFALAGKTRNIAFNWFCSNFAKQVARFCWQFYSTLMRYCRAEYYNLLFSGILFHPVFFL